MNDFKLNNNDGALLKCLSGGMALVCIRGFFSTRNVRKITKEFKAIYASMIYSSLPADCAQTTETDRKKPFRTYESWNFIISIFKN